MIDLHTHLLFGVDDGAQTIEESKELIQEAIDMGVSTIVLTPHYRKGRFEPSWDLLQEHFYELRSYFKNVTILLGREIYCQQGIEQDFSDDWTLGESKTVLLEFRRDSTFVEIYNYVLLFLQKNYVVLLAHIERYPMLSVEEIERLRNIGCWIQVNADNVAPIQWFDKKRQIKQLVQELIKKGMVDVIASDTHNQKTRPNKMENAYRFIEKKYGKSTAVLLFDANPQRLLTQTKIKS